MGTGQRGGGDWDGGMGRDRRAGKGREWGGVGREGEMGRVRLGWAMGRGRWKGGQQAGGDGEG